MRFPSFASPKAIGVTEQALAVKLAVIVRSELMVTVHGSVPLQPPPLHPAVNVEPAPGTAVSVAVEPTSNSALQVKPHEIFGPVTVPKPLPAFAAVSVTLTEIETVAGLLSKFPSLALNVKLSGPA